MSPDKPQEIGDATIEFEQALERLILGSFTEGVPVEGAWGITVPIADAPDWTITIEKAYSEEEPPYRPNLLEE